MNILAFISTVIITFAFTTKDKIVETEATDYKSFPYKWCLN